MRGDNAAGGMRIVLPWSGDFSGAGSPDKDFGANPLNSFNLRVVLFEYLNQEHLLEDDKSNGLILKRNLASHFFFAFCLFDPQKMTSVVEST